MGAHADKFRSCRWAMVVDDPASYGMARMGQSLMEDMAVSFEIFSDPEAAEAWLRGAEPPAS